MEFFLPTKKKRCLDHNPDMAWNYFKELFATFEQFKKKKLKYSDSLIKSYLNSFSPLAPQFGVYSAQIQGAFKDNTIKKQIYLTARKKTTGSN